MTAPRRPVIFDMDGVLVDSEPVYERGFVAYVTGAGRPDLASWYGNTLGRRQADFAPELAALLGVEADELIAGLRACVRPQLEAGVEPMPGVPDVVRRIAAGRPVALASSSRAWFVERALRHVGVDQLLAVRATGDEVQAGKPSPDLYLLAAERLGVDPATAVAVEDTPAGVASANAAGMTSIAIPNAHTRDLDLSAADVVVADLDAAAGWIAARDAA